MWGNSRYLLTHCSKGKSGGTVDIYLPTVQRVKVGRTVDIYLPTVLTGKSGGTVDIYLPTVQRVKVGEQFTFTYPLFNG